ncbi:MAG: cobalamin-dependent protein [Chloroflexota bacterium]
MSEPLLTGQGMPLPAGQIRAALIEHVLELNETEVLALVQERLQSGDDPLALVEACEAGMRRVGERYEQGDYFLSALIMAGEIFREVMELVQPVIEDRIRGNESGRILLGTVQHDIHDIGKNIQGILLSCYGFTVLDLGVDVPPGEFLAQAIQFQPDIIGLSGLLTSSYDSMRETIITLRQSDDNGLARLPIIIGGGMLNEQVRQYVGADYWVGNSMDGVRLCQRLLAEQRAA